MAYEGEGNIDTMGLGGVGGGWFGGDPEGSGGSKLTGLGVKDGVETTPKEEQEFWDSVRNVTLAAPTQPLSFWADVFNFHKTGKSLLAAKGLKANPLGIFDKEDVLDFFEDEDKAGKTLFGILSEIMDLDAAKNLTQVQKGIVVDSFVSSLAKGWSGIAIGKTVFCDGIKVDDKINKSLEKAIEGPKGYKAINNIPSLHLTPQEEFGVIYDDEDPEVPESKKSFNVYAGYRQDEKDEKEDKKDLDVDAKVNNYLGKKPNLNTIMAEVEARQNKGRLVGGPHNIGYRGPVKSVTTPLGAGKSFTQVQANVPTGQWSAVQQGKVGPIQGMIGVKGKGLDPNSLAPVGDISLNPAQSLSFSPFSAVQGKFGYNTDKGAYGSAGVTASGKAFGGTWGANIGYNTDQGPVAGFNFNYNW